MRLRPSPFALQVLRMFDDELAASFTCEACGWTSQCSEEGILRRLRAAGMLRRAKQPDRQILLELLNGAGPQMPCPECGMTGLRVRPLSEADNQWEDAALCEICRKPIPPERLEAMPGATRCIDCQRSEEQGTPSCEPEYCPKCGALLVLRTSRGAGVTRYKLFCTGTPACRI